MGCPHAVFSHGNHALLPFTFGLTSPSGALTCLFFPWKSRFTSLYLWAYVPLWGAHMLFFPMEITLYVPLALGFLWAYVPLWGAHMLVFPSEITLYVPAPRLAVYNINSQTEHGEVRTEDLEGSSVVRGTRLSTGPHVTHVHAHAKHITGTPVLCHSLMPHGFKPCENTYNLCARMTLATCADKNDA